MSLEVLTQNQPISTLIKLMMTWIFLDENQNRTAYYQCAIAILIFRKKMRTSVLNLEETNQYSQF